MTKRYLLAMTLMTALSLMPAFAWAQQGSGSGGPDMMGGQQGGMMQGNTPMGQGQMMSNMMDMMEQMSGMMEKMAGMMNGMSPGAMQDMSALMGSMSRQMNDMANAMHSGQISADHMRAMNEMMSQMQGRLSAMEN